MARGRMISKSLSTSRKFAELATVAGPLAEFCQLLFPLLVSHADDYGRLSGDAFTVKFQVFPISPRPVEDFELALEHIAAAGLIERYEAGGDKVIQIVKFDEHQTGLHKRSGSKFPESPGTSGNFRENPGDSRLTEEKRTEQKGTELNRTEQKARASDAGRVGAFVDWYRDTHQRLIGVAYIGNARKDYETSLELVKAFSDSDLQDAALVWFGMDDDFARKGTRSIPKFASRASGCLELARKVSA